MLEVGGWVLTSVPMTWFLVHKKARFWPTCRPFKLKGYYQKSTEAAPTTCSVSSMKSLLSVLVAALNTALLRGWLEATGSYCEQESTYIPASGRLAEYRSRKSLSLGQTHSGAWILWLLILAHVGKGLHNTLTNLCTLIAFNFTKWEHLCNLYQLINKPQTSLQIHMLISQASENDWLMKNRSSCNCCPRRRGVSKGGKCGCLSGMLSPWVIAQLS